MDSTLYANCPDKKKNFLLDGLHALDLALCERGSRLIVRAGRPLEVLREILGEAGGGRIYAEEDYTPYARKRDSLVARELPITFVGGNLRVPPLDLQTQTGRPFQVFSPFARAWGALPWMNAGDRSLPERLPEVKAESLPLPSFVRNKNFPAGEKAARVILQVFTRESLYQYARRRDRPDLSGTSMLSAYLHLGMLSIERVFQAARNARSAAPDQDCAAGVDAWMNELIWREFYIHTLYHFPHTGHESFRPALRNIPWRNARDELEAWKYGRTGCPIVDAGMRQMLETGWMHNRVRMLAASYLVKDLLIDWREGERWFAANLIDYDQAANVGGWQWTAGTGTDSAPFFRIFNPVLQGRKFDPEGYYVRRWVPELNDIPGDFIHEPWKLPPAAFPKEYPRPLIDHQTARARALEFYSATRIGRVS